MIKSVTLELLVLPVEQLVLSEESQWIWATNLTTGGEWERIRVWEEKSFFGTGTVRKWSKEWSDLGYDKDWPLPFTHYTVLPRMNTVAY